MLAGSVLVIELESILRKAFGRSKGRDLAPSNSKKIVNKHVTRKADLLNQTAADEV